MSDFRDTFEDAVAFAAARGLVVVKPGPRDLFIDIDDEASLTTFYANLSAVERGLGAKVEMIQRPSPSGKPGRLHLTVRVPRDVTPLERIALQAILGSDRMREALSWIRLQNQQEHPTLFFERPEE